MIKKVENIYLFVVILLPFIDILVNFLVPSKVNLFVALSQALIIVLVLCINYKKIIDIKSLISVKYLSFIFITMIMGVRSIQGITSHNLTKWNAMSIFVFMLVILHCSEKLERKKLIDFIRKNVRLINLCICSFFIIVTFTIINRSGFEVLWGSTTLRGPFTLQHYLAYDLLIIIALSELMRFLTKNNWYLSYVIIALGFIFMSGVRTILLALAVLIIREFVMIKSTKTKLVIAGSGIASVVVVFLTGIYKLIPILAKFGNTLHGGSISNGRNVFWVKDFEEFFQLDLSKKLFGAGANWIFELNVKVINQYIHAHNDYINIMVMFGIVSLVLFIAFNFSCINFRNKYLFMLAMFSLAFFNGLFTYSIFVISMPIIVIFFDYAGDKEEMEEMDG
jgi:hypothetical protein